LKLATKDTFKNFFAHPLGIECTTETLRTALHVAQLKVFEAVRLRTAKSAEEMFNRVQFPHPRLPAGRDFALTFLALFVSRQKGRKVLDHPVGETIRYHIRTGKHDFTLYDWQQYLDFADKQFGRSGNSN
jgi:hypothetical protein